VKVTTAVREPSGRSTDLTFLTFSRAAFRLTGLTSAEGKKYFRMISALGFSAVLPVLHHRDALPDPPPEEDELPHHCAAAST
jgi:hypothetical protein